MEHELEERAIEEKRAILARKMIRIIRFPQLIMINRLLLLDLIM